MFSGDVYSMSRRFTLIVKITKLLWFSFGRMSLTSGSAKVKQAYPKKNAHLTGATLPVLSILKVIELRQF